MEEKFIKTVTFNKNEYPRTEFFCVSSENFNVENAVKTAFETFLLSKDGEEYRGIHFDWDVIDLIDDKYLKKEGLIRFDPFKLDNIAKIHHMECFDDMLDGQMRICA